MRIFLLILIAAATLSFSAETVNPALKPTLDTYEQEAAKAYAAYLQAAGKAAEKANKDLDAKLKAAMKKGDLELATVIKKQMDELAKGKTLTEFETAWKTSLASAGELQAPKPEGDWDIIINGALKGFVTFKEDGKIVNQWKENWTLETKGKVTTIITEKSGMKNITITETKDGYMKGTSGIGQTIELKKKAE